MSLPYEVNNMLYGPRLSQLLSRDSIDDEYYYNVMRDRPISKEEINDVLEDYSGTIISFYSYTSIGPGHDGILDKIISMGQIHYISSCNEYYPYDVYGYTVLGEGCYITHHSHGEVNGTEKPQIDINIGYDMSGHMVTPDDFQILGREFDVPDLYFIYEVYSRRLSLIRINENYAREKVKEYFRECINFLFNHEIIEGMLHYQVYLFLVSQCIVLRIQYHKVKLLSPIDNIQELNEEMISKIYAFIENKM